MIKTTLVFEILIVVLFEFRVVEATFGSVQRQTPLPAFVSHLYPNDRTTKTIGSFSPNYLLSAVHTRTRIQPFMVASLDKPMATAPTTASLEDRWSQENLEHCREMWSLSPVEMIHLRQLHENLSDILQGDTKMNSPWEVVRFLKEHKGNPKVTEAKFRDMIQWRQERQVDKMLDSKEYRPPSLYRYFPAGVLQGVDKDGDPIHVERTGSADSSGLLSRYGREEMIKQAIWIREVQSRGQWHEDYEEQHGHPVKQFTVIMDMQGLKARNMGPGLISASQEVSRIVQDYYPSYAKRIIVIRAPAIFQFAYNALKPFIDESMKEKIIIAGGNNPSKVLGEYMDLKVLPKEVCSEGQGTAVEDFERVVWQGGKIPDHEEVIPEVITIPQMVVAEVQQDMVSPKPQPAQANKPVMPSISTPIKVLPTPVEVTKPYNRSSAATIPHPPVSEKPSNWIRRQLQLFQSSFSSFDGKGFGYPYAI